MFDTIEQESQQVIATVIALIPDIFGALLLLLIGWLVAGFFKLVAGRLMLSTSQFLTSRLLSTRWEFIRIPGTARTLIGEFIFWATMLVFIAIAVRLVGFTGAAGWLDRLVVYLPSLLAGGLIIVGGFILGAVGRKLVVHTAAAADVAQPQWLGQLVQTVLVIAGLVIGLGQIGIDVTFLIIVFGIVLAAVLAGFSLAFGLGARTLVENLIANQHVKQWVKPGQMATIGDHRGRVLEFTATGVMLETERGRFVIPARLCLEQGLLLIADDAIKPRADEGEHDHH